MEIEHIKVNGTYYYPMPAGVQEDGCYPGFCHNVCFIKKLMFGRFQIDYYDKYISNKNGGSDLFKGNQTPNARIIAYPSGIQEIKYKLKSK